MKQAGIDPNSWEGTADNRLLWKAAVNEGVRKAEDTRNNQLADKRAKRKTRTVLADAPTSYVCTKCSKDCHSRVGLYSHSRQC